MPWCYDDAACVAATFVQLLRPGNDVGRASRLKLKDWIAIGEGEIEKSIGLFKVRETTRDPAAVALHVLSFIFYRSGHWLLPQFLDFFANRFGDDVAITLFDNDGDRLGDGRRELAERHDCAVVLIRAAPNAREAWVNFEGTFYHPDNWRTSGISPLSYTGIRNYYWKKLRRMRPDAWVLIADIDEFVDVSPERLALWDAVGVTAVRAVGYNLVGFSRDLTQISRGKRDARFNKACLFRVDAVDELHSTVGFHDALPEPAEEIVWGATALYHFRYVDLRRPADSDREIHVTDAFRRSRRTPSATSGCPASPRTASGRASTRAAGRPRTRGSGAT